MTTVVELDRITTPRGADYNAFGYDPEGVLAHLASHMYGPSWRPGYDVCQFVGAPEPPRYGHPAPYQEAYLPAGFTPQTPPLYYGQPCPPFIRPPIRFNRNHFAAMQFSERLSNAIVAVRRQHLIEEGRYRGHLGDEGDGLGGGEEDTDCEEDAE